MKKVLMWEFVGFVSLLLVLGAFSMPLFDDQFMGKKENEIIIRLNTEEAGGFMPGDITVKRGETVKLILVGQDVTHGFMIEGLLDDVGTINPGEKKIVEFTPQETGVYIMICTVYCSPEHHNMTGKVTVEG